MSAPHTILLLTRGSAYLEREGKLNSASTPITPGMLIHVATGGGDKPLVEPHDTAAAVPSPIMVATELPQRFGSGIDDPYNVVNEVVEYYIPLPGEHLYMFLEAAGNVAAGALLESNGAGALQADTGGAIFKALEAVNNSAGGSPARIRVEVL